MAVKDLELRKGVRAILSRHWIDPEKIQIMVQRSNIRLSGELRCLSAGGRRSIDLMVVQQIFQELRKLSGVRRVQTQDLVVEFAGGLRRLG